MIERLPDGLLQPLRKQFLSGQNGEMLQSLGHYIQWFGIAEMGITQALCLVLDFNDLDRFNYLVRGMDARIKCERLRQAAKQYWPLGPYLSGELEIFEKNCIGTRNSITHSWPVLNEQTQIIHYASLGKMPNIKDGKVPKNLSKREGIHIDDLFSQAMWLNGFSGDLVDALRVSKRGELLETTESRRHQPLEDH